MILWQRLDWPGHEAAAITQQRNRWNLAGTALFVMHEQPCRLDYEIECDMHWGTRDVSIRGEVGGAPASLVLSRTPDGEWIVDDRPLPLARGCTDVDLGFSPATNSLPIRRLKLAIGESAPVRAAWVKFPQLTVSVLEQTYTRLSESVYLYVSAGGMIERELTVNEDGFVVEDPGMWRAAGR
jgi:hypothetical protein